MKIIPFLDNHKKPLYQLCESLNKKYHYDNHIPPDILSSKDFEGFVAISEDGELIGFVGVVFTPAYAYPFGLRVHPDFFKKSVGLALSKYVGEYALRKNPVIKSAFLSDNKAMQKIISADGWNSVGDYFISTKEAPFDGFVVRNEVYTASTEELNEVINFVTRTKIGQKEYDQMFLKDLIWYPTAFSQKIFEELILFKRLLVEKKRNNISAVCIINKKDNSNGNLEISRLWGNSESLIGFIVENYRPQKIKICVGEAEKEKWQKLGFSTALTFYNDELFESKYALIEKRRQAQL